MWVFNIAYYYLRFHPAWSLRQGSPGSPLSIVINNDQSTNYITFLHRNTVQVASQKVVISERDRRQNHKSIK